MTRTTIISLPPAARIYIATAIMALMLMTNIHPLGQDKSRLSPIKPGRSVVRSQHAMVATSQPLASQVAPEVVQALGETGHTRERDILARVIG